MPPKKQQLHILVDAERFDADSIKGVYSDKKSADAALEASGEHLEIVKMEVKEFSGAESKTNKAKAAANGKAKATKKAKEPAPEDDEDEVADEDEAPPAKKAAPQKQTKRKDDSKKQIPDGIPGALEGLRLIFTGTFDAMDRPTSKATAEKYGAKIVSKLELTDYVVMGVKAGPKKIEEIKQLGLDTIDEQGFFDMLKHGMPDEKRAQIEARAADEPAKKKQKK